MQSRVLLQRRTHRVTFTVPDCVFQQLITCSNEQGRSISNLCAFLIEQGLQPVTRTTHHDRMLC